MEYVNRAYGTAYEVGQRVRVNGRKGVIAPRPDHMGEHYIAIDFGTHVAPCHPTWEVELLEQGGSDAQD